RRLVLEAHIALNGLQRQRAIHRSRLNVHVAKFARQPRSDGALPRSRRSIDGNDQLPSRFTHRAPRLGKTRLFVAGRGTCGTTSGVISIMLLPPMVTKLNSRAASKA